MFEQAEPFERSDRRLARMIHAAIEMRSVCAANTDGMVGSGLAVSWLVGAPRCWHGLPNAKGLSALRPAPIDERNGVKASW